MGLIDQLKNRRFVQIVAGYAGVGWLALQVPDQLADRGVVPEFVYLIALTWYAGGFLAAAVVGWFHGEKGRQEFSKPEIVLLSLIGLGVVAATWNTVAGNREATQLEALAASTSLDLKRVAVLYFEDLSGTGSDQFLADGLTESLISELSTVAGLDVVSRNGSGQFRDSGLQPDSIARALAAGSFVHGTVERRGGELRVEAGLYDAESGSSVERQVFEGSSEDPSLLRADLGQEVARFLRGWLGEEIRLRSGRADSQNPAAWVTLQRAERAGKDAMARLAEDDLSGAYSYFDLADSMLVQAQSLDEAWPNPTILRARLVYEQSRLEHDPTDSDVLMRQALEHVEQALVIDDRNPDAHRLRGTILYVRWLLGLETDPRAADVLLESAGTDLRTATEIDPLQAEAWNVLAHYYYQQDDILEANNAARQAYEADAYLAAADDILWRLWSTSYDLEVHRQASRWCEEGGNRFPENPRFSECQLWNMTSRAAEAVPARAWELVEDVVSRTPEGEQPLARLQMQVLVAGALARADQADSARAVLDRSLGNPEIDPVQELPLTHAFVRTLLGDEAEAVTLLQRYLAANPDRREGFAEHGHWWWRSLQENPEFRQLVGLGADD